MISGFNFCHPVVRSLVAGVFDHGVRHGHCVMRPHNTEMNRYVEGEVRQSRIRSVEAEFVMDKMEGRGEVSI